MLLVGHLGLYLNLGEVLDFILGFTTLDIAHDDGVKKGAPLWRIYNESAHPESLSVRQALRALDSDDVKARRRAIIKLSVSRDPDTAGALVMALQDSDAHIRYVAASTLGDMGYKGAVGPLIALLNDEDEWVVQAAYEALQQITGEDFGYDPAKWEAWWKTNR